jgi:hypothetical protein
LFGTPIARIPNLMRGSIMRGDRKLKLDRKFYQNYSWVSGLKESIRFFSSNEILS